MHPSASLQLLSLINGFQVSQAICVAARLGIPDLLSRGEQDLPELAAATRTHPPSLYRLLRALAAVGVLHERPERRFALLPLGDPLRSDASSSRNAWACLVGRPMYFQAWANLLGSIESGETAFDKAHGMSVWDFRAQRPEEAQTFDRAMATITEEVAEAVLSVFDFARYQTVADIGGGQGTFIGRILARHRAIDGVLFDLPPVIERAAAWIQAAGLADRCRLVGGSFFEGVPAGADAYLLKWILHDWGDEEAVAILKSCRGAIATGGSLIIVEHLVGEPNEGLASKLMDLNMMVITGGVERTRDEFTKILRQAGFALSRVVQTRTAANILEAMPA
jgi:hypothetical protein